ncbi:hypothetical protein HYS84_01980 [Candidatus Saccharibacteria bacterium]|nr:hypothetical protein [Candidatus Saccharibacteria bacterium]
MASVRTDTDTARQIKAMAQLRGISEEEFAAEIIRQYGENHADELRAGMEHLSRSKSTRRTTRLLRVLSTPEGAAVLARLYPPTTA